MAKLSGVSASRTTHPTAADGYPHRLVLDVRSSALQQVQHLRGCGDVGVDQQAGKRVLGGGGRRNTQHGENWGRACMGSREGHA
eukprot:220387-Chlamydomonas_euryale.AAC.2